MALAQTLSGGAAATARPPGAFALPAQDGRTGRDAGWGWPPERLGGHEDARHAVQVAGHGHRRISGAVDAEQGVRRDRRPVGALQPHLVDGGPAGGAGMSTTSSSARPPDWRSTTEAVL